MAKFRLKTRLESILQESDPADRLRRAEDHDREIENFLSTSTFPSSSGVAKFQWATRLYSVMTEKDRGLQLKKAEEYDRELENFLSSFPFV